MYITKKHISRRAHSSRNGGGSRTAVSGFDGARPDSFAENGRRAAAPAVHDRDGARGGRKHAYRRKTPLLVTRPGGCRFRVHSHIDVAQALSRIHHNRQQHGPEWRQALEPEGGRRRSYTLLRRLPDGRAPQDDGRGRCRMLVRRSTRFTRRNLARILPCRRSSFASRTPVPCRRPAGSDIAASIATRFHGLRRRIRCRWSGIPASSSNVCLARAARRKNVPPEAAKTAAFWIGSSTPWRG